jgi:hypothetical protein
MPYTFVPGVRRYLALLLITASACSGYTNTPTPTAPAFVAGSWGGLFQYYRLDFRPDIASDPFGMTLTQSGSSVSGTWFANYTFGGPATNGTVTGTVTSTTFSGTFTWNSNGGACTGTIAVSGPAGGTTFRWTGPAVIGNCDHLPTNPTFNVFSR